MLAYNDFTVKEGKLIQFYESQTVDQVLACQQVTNKMSNRDYMQTIIHWSKLNPKNVVTTELNEDLSNLINLKKLVI